MKSKAAKKSPARNSRVTEPKAVHSKSSAITVVKSKALATDPAKPAKTAKPVKSTKLAKTETPLLAEALRRANEVVRGAENHLSEYGEWLFVTLFGDDTSAVLDQELDHPVWSELLRVADTGRLQMSRSTLSSAVRIAAYNKRLDDGAWNALGYTQKYSLLPLREPKALRAAARHVLSASCTVRQTREYVENILHPDGKKLPRLSPEGAQRTVGSLRARFAAPKYLHKLEGALGKLSDERRTEATEDVQALIAQFQRLLVVLKK